MTRPSCSLEPCVKMRSADDDLAARVGSTEAVLASLAQSVANIEASLASLVSRQAEQTSRLSAVESTQAELVQQATRHHAQLQSQLEALTTRVTEPPPRSAVTAPPRRPSTTTERRRSSVHQRLTCQIQQLQHAFECEKQTNEHNAEISIFTMLLIS